MAHACRVRHLAYRTEQAYVGWVKRFILFHNKRHPSVMWAFEARAFLTHLAVNRRLAESTQNQALAAILFLYRHLLEQPLGSLDAVRARKPKRIPTVLSKDEVRRLIAALPDNASHRQIVELLYGTGMPISECCTIV